jgi:hypothetical protein
MLKHVGRHGDRKVAIVFREIPGDEHMCLVIYPDVLPTHIHNSIMSVLESAPGQQATNLADVFHRNLLSDGRNILQTLHHEGMLKKIATNQVILTPTPTSSVKLDEVNRLVKEMESGAEALKRMQEIDNNSGMVAPDVKRLAESEFKNRQSAQSQPLQAPATGALDDKSLAGNMLAQAKRMKNEAKAMVAEAARMKKDAERMDPYVTASTAPAPVVESAEPVKAKRTRGPNKPKTVVADATHG